MVIIQYKKESKGVRTREIEEELFKAHKLEQKILNECSEILCLARFSCSEKYNSKFLSQICQLRQKMEADAKKLVSKENVTKSMYLCRPSNMGRGLDMISSDEAEQLLLASAGGL